MDDLGDLTRDGDSYRLTFRRRLRHQPEKVWRAITEQEHLAAWFPDSVIGRIEPGASLRFEQPSGDGFDGRVLVFDPPKTLELAWGTDLVRIELEPEGDGTLLTFVDTITELGKAARDGAGWHECIANLVAHLDSTHADETWASVHPAYVEKFGPEASTIGPPGS